MDTISHGVWTYLLAHHYPERRWYAVLGAVYPDTLLAVMFILMFLQGDLDITSSWLQQLFANPTVFALDSAWHSLTLWSVLFSIAVIFRKVNLMWFVFGAYFHIALDIITHKHFIPGYFWPLGHPTVYGLVDYKTLGFTAANILLLTGYIIWYRRRSHV